EGQDAEIPEGGYRGEYLTDIAREIAKRVTFEPPLAERPEDERWRAALEHAAPIMLSEIEATLARFRIVFDSYLSERTLHESGLVDEAIRRMREAGHVYEAEGAVWFRATEFGDD